MINDKNLLFKNRNLPVKNKFSALFILFLFMAGAFLLSACQGGFSEKPPVHPNPNMDFQPKNTAQQNPAMVPLQAVPFGKSASASDTARDDLLRDDDAFYYGVVFSPGVEATPRELEQVRVVTQGTEVEAGVFSGATRYVAFAPLSVDETVMKRGQERFNIFCSACHDRTGAGLGLVVQRRVGMPQPVDLADERIQSMTDGEIFNVITHGRRNMMGYETQIPPSDRWAIVAYVRALQTARSATEQDVPPSIMERLRSERDNALQAQQQAEEGATTPE